MISFGPSQLKALSGKLDRRHVKTRSGEDGRELSYLEGWFVLSEANAIFGFGGWDREMVQFEKILEERDGRLTRCGYMARVKISVRAGRSLITREGTGFGAASSSDPCQAHERALKSAETDATKRALATFGTRFGLTLYDKDQSGLNGKPAPSTWTVFDDKGVPILHALSPESYCSALRQLIEKTPPDELGRWRLHNTDGLERLKTLMPGLKTAKGIHYADILFRLLAKRIEKSHSLEASHVGKPDIEYPLAPSKIAPGPRIDKAVLTIGAERKVRDKAHLKFVASHPCLICGREPSHAHHLKFAQKRGLSQKVSDEFTVPLCALHHGELHQSGAERGWWEKMGIDPLSVSKLLWEENRRPSFTEVDSQPEVSDTERGKTENETVLSAPPK